MSTGTALVLGANGLIGEAIAGQLAATGRPLVLAGRDGGRLEDQGRRLSGSGGVVRVVALDVRDDVALERLVAGIDDLAVAVNNVGVSHAPAPLDRLSLGDIDRVLSVTLRGVLMAMRHQLSFLRDGGSLVNVVSSAGLRGAPGMSAYVAAKHGVVGLTRTAALDHAARGVRVNAVAPGPIASGGLARQTPEVRERIGSFVPLGRVGTAQEVASAVGWLASDAASYTTGSVLEVDGGRSAGGA